MGQEMLTYRFRDLKNATIRDYYFQGGLDNSHVSNLGWYALSKGTKNRLSVVEISNETGTVTIKAKSIAT